MSALRITAQVAAPVVEPLSYCQICYSDHIPGKHVSLDQMEKNYILAVFEAKDHNIFQTAQVLEIARSSLHRKLDRYGVRR